MELPYFYSRFYILNNCYPYHFPICFNLSPNRLCSPNTCFPASYFFIIIGNPRITIFYYIVDEVEEFRCLLFFRGNKNYFFSFLKKTKNTSTFIPQYVSVRLLLLNSMPWLPNSVLLPIEKNVIFKRGHGQKHFCKTKVLNQFPTIDLHLLQSE